MENHSLASHPDSRHSSPYSQEVDNENTSMDDPFFTTTTNNNHKVKFMCSYGGNIQFRTHDNQLAYVGGDTKIMAVDRNAKLSAMTAKLSSLCNADVFIKYQLLREDLDALILVTNDEDLEHMLIEYDLSQRESVKPARLRLFLFPPKPLALTSFESNDLKSEQQRFIDALNFVHIPHVKGTSTSVAASAANLDFLSGLDYRYSIVPATKLPDFVPPPASAIPPAETNGSPMGTDRGSEDRNVVGEPTESPVEIQIQIEESQRLHWEKNDQVQPTGDEDNGTVNKSMDYNSQRNLKKLKAPPVHIVPAPVSIARSVTVYLPERLMTSAGYSLAALVTVTDQPLYLIATPVIMYHATTLRAVTGTSRIGANSVEASGIAQPKVEVGEPTGYPLMVYKDAGRQVFITAPAAWGGVVPPHLEVATGSDGTQGGGGTALSQEGKVSKADFTV
ncbi:uncharacterized protein LOC129301980 [Prosopis cineraria]|uniref:uncharacterized protein LOC129301980 n=1 Tax=Prosopis cineraria TaxID=364024 RepID=UPI00240F5363|nr:uncharacterized protein LOC129301980 [Prosopis cineraria]